MSIDKFKTRGNFGIVHKAKWRGADCVVKKLTFKGNETILNDFVREAQTMR